MGCVRPTVVRKRSGRSPTSPYEQNLPLKLVLKSRCSNTGRNLEHPNDGGVTRLALAPKPPDQPWTQCALPSMMALCAVVHSTIVRQQTTILFLH